MKKIISKFLYVRKSSKEFSLYRSFWVSKSFTKILLVDVNHRRRKRRSIRGPEACLRKSAYFYCHLECRPWRKRGREESTYVVLWVSGRRSKFVRSLDSPLQRTYRASYTQHSESIPAGLTASVDVTGCCTAVAAIASISTSRSSLLSSQPHTFKAYTEKMQERNEPRATWSHRLGAS